MKHPLFSNKTSFGIYLTAWVLLLGMQSLAFFQLFHVTWEYALADGLVFGVLFLLLASGSWYFLKYSKFERISEISFLVEQLTSAILLVSIWVFGGTYLLAFLFKDATDYIALLSDAYAWRFVNGFFLYVLLVGVFYLHIKQSEELERKERETKLLASLQNTEIDLLRSKLNPHFLFNSLNSLNALIQVDSEKASNMLVHLADYLRFSIEVDKQDEVSLAEEIRNLHRYIAIEQVRFGNRLIIEEKIDEIALESKLPAMLLQPLFENAIKYGLGSLSEQVHIYLSALLENAQLKLLIVNEFDPEVHVKNGSGNGLENVRKRLDIKYKKSAVFKYSRTDREFRVTINIPQKQNHEEA